MKYQSAAVIQSAVSPLKTTPPSTGSAQPGESSRVKINILQMKAPKKKQPRIECTATRASNVWNPSAYRQCTATGTVKATAIRPDQRWSGATQLPLNGIRPKSPSPVTSCTHPKTKATVVSADLAARPLEKPARLIA